MYDVCLQMYGSYCIYYVHDPTSRVKDDSKTKIVALNERTIVLYYIYIGTGRLWWHRFLSTSIKAFVLSS